MNFQFYLEKLFDSEEFQKFMEENKTAYPCSAFFIIDKEKGEDKQHFDYYISEDKKMFSFKLEGKIEKLPIEMIHDDVPSKITANYDFDFNEVEKLILEKMEEEGVKNTVQKIILSLQNIDGKDFLVGTVFISALGLIKVKIDLENMGITDFEKKSFLDMFQIKKT